MRQKVARYVSLNLSSSRTGTTFLTHPVHTGTQFVFVITFHEQLHEGLSGVHPALGISRLWLLRSCK